MAASSRERVGARRAPGLRVAALLAGLAGLASLSPPPAAAAAEATPPLLVPAAGRDYVLREVIVSGTPHKFAIHVPPQYDPARAWPCVVFLHGSGECGDDGEKPTKVGLLPAVLAHPERWPCFVVLPQKPSEDQEWEEQETLVLNALAQAREEYRIDADRIVLTGMSQGGHGVWTIGARHAWLFSCLAPVCGYGRPKTIASRVARLPVWAFHGERDDVVDPAESRRIVDAVREARRKLGLDPEGARLTLYPEANHDSWDPAYGEPELPVWMLAQARREPGHPD